MMRHTEAASTEAKSLAQYIANVGGINVDGMALQGEVDRLRELNARLRGRNALVRLSGGKAYDVALLDAQDAGYDVDEANFLELIEADAVALLDGSDRGRVWASTKDWEDEVDELWAEYTDYLAAEELEDEDEAEAAYVANAASGVCHHADCHHVERMNETNRVELAEPTADFRPCAHCQPKAYTLWKVQELELEATTDEVDELEAAAGQERDGYTEALRLQIGAKR